MMVGVVLLVSAVSGLPKLAVLPVQLIAKVDKQVSGVIDDYVLTAAQQSGKYDVIGQSDMNALLGFEKQKEALGCDEMACYADIAGALGVDELLSMKIARIKDHWSVTASLIAFGKGNPHVENRVAERVAGDEDALLDFMTSVVRKLLGVEQTAAAATAGVPSKAPAEPPSVPVAISVRGSFDRGAFARLAVWVNGHPFKELDTTAETREYRLDVPADACTVSFMLANDSCSGCVQGDARKGDRNLYVETIRVRDKVYAAGSRGLFKQDCGWQEEGPTSLVLRCQNSELTVPVTATPGPSTVVVRARGENDRERWPHMLVTGNGRLLGAASPEGRTADYRFTSSDKVCWVEVFFDNDRYSCAGSIAPGCDVNVAVESVTVDGKTIDTLTGDTFVSDCISMDYLPITLGIPKKNTLMCNSAGFYYRLRQ
jgi:hypothetical protein